MEFIKLLYMRSLFDGKQLPDWLSVNYFGEAEEYNGTIFVNCSNRKTMQTILEWVYEKEYPGYDHTAFYPAITKAAIEIIEHDKKLQNLGVPENTYERTIILITDGKDESKSWELKRKIKKFFQNDYIHLFLVGVGRDSDVEEFEDIAKWAVKVDDFERLPEVLLLFLTF